MVGRGFGRRGLGDMGASGSAPFGPRVIPATRRAPPQSAVTARPAFSQTTAFGPAKNERSLAMAYLLWFFVGSFSAHRFYLGAAQSATVQLGFAFFAIALFLAGAPWGFLGFFILTLWCLWLTADLFLLPGVHRKFCRSGAAYEGFS